MESRCAELKTAVLNAIQDATGLFAGPSTGSRKKIKKSLITVPVVRPAGKVFLILH
ncbi:hypothetical protein [Acidianus two-tailed virus 2]|nr:hypothetical protein [Acidianus two-tailed virus 2]